MENIELDFAKVDYSNHLLKIIYKPNQEIDLEKIKILIDLATKVIGDKPFCSLAVVTPGSDFEKEARDYLANHDELDYRASAVVASTIPVRMIVNMFINFSRPKIPTKLFGTTNQALEWIEPYLEKCRMSKYTN